MKKSTLPEKAISLLYTHKNYGSAKKSLLVNAIGRFETRISGKRGAEDIRERFYAALENIYPKTTKHYPLTPAKSHEYRLSSWKSNSAKFLAEKAGLHSDEHGSWRGDHISVSGVDFVGPWESAAAPYHDTGAEGLGLVFVTRTRVYAKSSNWRPSSVSTTFLVGKNEAGTYFSHPVSPNCNTIIDALQWIWNGKAYQIIQRQGDIALVGGNGGPKMPSNLPWGHKINGTIITHDTHPELRMPAVKGERIIVGRRAAERASEATRD